MSELHLKTIDEIVRELQHDESVLAINIFGSMARGDARPDSDIDIEIISTSEPEWRMAEEERNGLTIDYVYTPRDFLLEKVRNYPFLSYVHTQEKIIYDPQGFMVGIQNELVDYFNSHPEVTTFWQQKITLMKEEKVKGTKNPAGGIQTYDEAELLFSDTHTITRSFWRT